MLKEGLNYHVVGVDTFSGLEVVASPCDTGKLHGSQRGNNLFVYEKAAMKLDALCDLGQCLEIDTRIEGYMVAVWAPYHAHQHETGIFKDDNTEQQQWKNILMGRRRGQRQSRRR